MFRTPFFYVRAMTDPEIATLFSQNPTIAIVGASKNPSRPVYGVMAYMIEAGFDVIPVNPGLAGQELLGKTVVATVSEIERPVHIVDVFRQSDAVPQIVEEVLSLGEDRPVLWLQLGIHHPVAEAEAKVAGMPVVSGKCIKIEHQRLLA